jgi:hypothetical protein
MVDSRAEGSALMEARRRLGDEPRPPPLTTTELAPQPPSRPRQRLPPNPRRGFRGCSAAYGDGGYPRLKPRKCWLARQTSASAFNFDYF